MEETSLLESVRDSGILLVSAFAERGGGQVVLLKLASRLHHYGYRPIVVLFASGPLAGELRALGVTTYVIPAGRVRQPLRFVRVVWHLGRLIGRHRLSLAQSDAGKSHLYAGLAALIKRIPAMLLVQEFIAPSDPWARLADLIPIAGIAAYSRASLDVYMQKRPRRRQEAVIYPGVEPAMLADESEGAMTALRTELGVPREALVVAIVGRLQPWKGQHIFLEAAAAVLKRYGNVHFLVVGGALFGLDTDYPNQLHAIVERHGIAPYVTLTGHRGDVSHILSLADVVVHASIEAEAFGQVIIEGMARGKAVIASAAGGPLEIIDHGVNGLLIPPGVPTDLADAVTGLLQDAQRRADIGRAAKRTVEQRFTEDEMTRRFVRFYDTALSYCQDV